MTNKVYLAACQDYDKERVESCIRRMFNAFGGVEALLQKGKRVTVKPNLLMAREPEAATTTHPAVVEAVVRDHVQLAGLSALMTTTVENMAKTIEASISYPKA